MTSYLDLYQATKGQLKLLAGNEAEAFAQAFDPTALPPQAADLQNIDYGLNLNRLEIPTNPYQVFHCGVPGIQSYLYFLINDVFYREQSVRNESLPEGVVVCSMAEAKAQHPEWVSPYLNHQVERKQAVEMLNGMFAQDGFFIYVPDGVKLEYPIQIVNVMHTPVPMMATAHNLVVMGKESKAQVVVCDHTMDDIACCANRITEVVVGEGAQYEHYKLEDTNEKMCNLSSLLIAQQAGSEVLANIITLRNGTTRNLIRIHQNGAEAKTCLCGMVVSAGKQSTTNITALTHHSTGGKSEELFKYVLDGESKGHFEGLLVVAPNAQKTDANQTNRNLLLSSSARMRTLPQLEIYADDVHCSHGASTGQLDEQALFYMRQRGISPKEAYLLLMNAFLSDVIAHIRVEKLQERITALVDKRLRHLEAGCESCQECGTLPN